MHKPPAALAGLAGSKAAPAFGIESDSEAVNPDDVAGTSGPSLKEQQQHKCQGDYTAEVRGAPCYHPRTLMLHR